MNRRFFWCFSFLEYQFSLWFIASLYVYSKNTHLLQHNIFTVPLNDELDGNDRILDVESRDWKNKIRLENKRTRSRLVFKCKYFDNSLLKSNKFSGNGLILVYLSLHWHVNHGYYPTTLETIFKLAAIEQTTFDNNRDKARAKKDENCIFGLFLAKNSCEKTSKVRFCETYINSLNESKFKHVNFYVGNRYFYCIKYETKLEKKSKIKNNFNEFAYLLIGISQNGVMLINPLNNLKNEYFEMINICDIKCCKVNEKSKDLISFGDTLTIQFVDSNFNAQIDSSDAPFILKQYTFATAGGNGRAQKMCQLINLYVSSVS